MPWEERQPHENGNELPQTVNEKEQPRQTHWTAMHQKLLCEKKCIQQAEEGGDKAQSIYAGHHPKGGADPLELSLELLLFASEHPD